MHCYSKPYMETPNVNLFYGVHVVFKHSKDITILIFFSVV